MSVENEHDIALQLMNLLKDEGVFKQRIQEYAKIKSDAEATQARVNREAEEHRKTTDEMDNYVLGKKNELLAAQRAHDRSANEAKSRIRLASQHVAEALRVRKENEAKEVELSERENVVNDAMRQMEEVKNETRRLNDEARRLRDDLQRRHEILNKAISEASL